MLRYSTASWRSMFPCLSMQWKLPRKNLPSLIPTSIWRNKSFLTRAIASKLDDSSEVDATMVVLLSASSCSIFHNRFLFLVYILKTSRTHKKEQSTRNQVHKHYQNPSTNTNQDQKIPRRWCLFVRSSNLLSFRSEGSGNPGINLRRRSAAETIVGKDDIDYHVLSVRGAGVRDVGLKSIIL